MNKQSDCRWVFSGVLSSSTIPTNAVLSFILYFSLSLPLSAQRIESEFKLAVPAGQEEAIWQYLKENFSTEKLKTINNVLSSTTEEEYFIDLYFDDSEKHLLSQNGGVRYRQRFLGDSLLKQLVQLKLASEDTSGVARQEVKFNVYQNPKKSDRQAMHPFWKYIKPKDRDEVNLYLFPLGVEANKLQPALKMEQSRRRVYIHEYGEPMVTITLDQAMSAYFPYPSFTEMEIELNEVRYTQANFAEKKRLENFNETIKKQIMQQFPSLHQDQTPKYNKMHALVSGNVLTMIVGNVPYIVLAGIFGFALFLFLTVKRPLLSS